MRKAHRLHPLIIDVVDQFSAFRNQAQKRKRYYTSKHFEITTAEHEDGNEFDGLVMSSEDMHTRVFVEESGETTSDVGKDNSETTLDMFLKSDSSDSSGAKTRRVKHEPYGFLSSDSDDCDGSI
jgi:hypothetical protein